MLKSRGWSRLSEVGARLLAARFELLRPLVFFDLETTGLDPAEDRIVELAAVRMRPDGRMDLFDTLVDPRVPIPREATRVHGIDAAAVHGAPCFGDLVPRVSELLEGADLAGYNVLRFDVPLLQAELDRAGVELDLSTAAVVDVCALFKIKERRDLSTAYRFYCDAERHGGHAAAADVQATIEVLAGQLDRYSDLEPDVEEFDLLIRPQRPNGFRGS